MNRSNQSCYGTSNSYGQSFSSPSSSPRRGVLAKWTSKKKAFGAGLLCLCSLLVALFTPSSASALDIGYIKVFSGGIESSNIRLSTGLQTCTTKLGGGLSCAIAPAANLEGLTLRTSSFIPSNSVVHINISFSSKNLYNAGSWLGFAAQGGWSVLDQDVVSNFFTDEQYVTVNLTLFYGEYGQTNVIDLIPYGQSQVISLSMPSMIRISAYDGGEVIDGSWFADTLSYVQQNTAKIQTTNEILASIRDKGITAKVDNSGVINAVNSASQNQVNATNANTTAVNNAANQAHKDSQNQIASQDKTTAAIDEQTKQQQDQYDQEKQEEQDRENQGKDDMSEATGIFNFNLLNPFAGIFGLFKPPSTCANIPTIARWVHSETSTVCSWWSSDVTSVLTPVFGIVSMMIVFGFLVHWLSGSSGNGSVDIGWDADFYTKGHGESF